jgi:tryptophanyl-tRNA synthetase
MSIVMDSRTPAEPKPDAERNICIQLLKLVAPPAAAADLEARLRAGGLGYGDLKKALFEHFWAFFAAARERRVALLEDPGYVDQVLKEGAERARSVASVVIRRARRAAGLE